MLIVKGKRHSQWEEPDQAITSATLERGLQGYPLSTCHATVTCAMIFTGSLNYAN